MRLTGEKLAGVPYEQPQRLLAFAVRCPCGRSYWHLAKNERVECPCGKKALFSVLLKELGDRQGESDAKKVEREIDSSPSGAQTP